jgi:diguanylate cyclase (GGDEF)-like protein
MGSVRIRRTGLGLGGIKMMHDWNEYRQQLLITIGEMAKISPDTVRGYRALSDAGAKTGHLDAKTRELIALAVAVTQQCDGCITVHTDAAVKHGATREEIKRACRSRQLLSLILCDVDFFKSYNDHYGHVAGDKCLHAIGQFLLRTFKRVSDLPARYGGEEFAVIFPDTPPGNAEQLAEKLHQGMIAQAIPHAFSAAAKFVTLSFGVVEALPTRERNAAW